MNGFCHIEIPCTDFAKVGIFYTDVFDWIVTEVSEMNYAMFRTPDGPGGGFSKQATIAAEPGIALYIEVDDIEATLEKIEEAGGKKIHPKTAIAPGFGFFGIFADVEGNSIGLWSKQ